MSVPDRKHSMVSERPSTGTADFTCTFTSSRQNIREWELLVSERYIILECGNLHRSILDEDCDVLAFFTRFILRLN